MEELFMFTFLGGSALSDYRTGKIPNRWLMFGTICLMTLRWIRGPSIQPAIWITEFLLFLFCTSATIIVLFPLFLFCMVGAGDIKLMAMIIGFLGVHRGAKVLFYGLAVSAVWSFLIMIHKNILKKRITYFFTYWKQSIHMGCIVPYYDAKKDQTEASIRLAPFMWYGFCIFLAERLGG